MSQKVASTVVVANALAHYRMALGTCAGCVGYIYIYVAIKSRLRRFSQTAVTTLIAKAVPIKLIIILSRNSFKIHLLFLKLFSIKTTLLP